MATVRGSGAPGDSGVTLRLAGEFAVRRAGHPAAAAALGSRKARALLKVLAVERGRLVPVDRLTEVLWGDEPPQRPAENIATLVSRLRGTLGADAIVGGRDGYRLGGPPAIEVDLDRAAEHVTAAERRLAAGEPAFAAVSAASALDLLGDGTALAEDPYADWAEPARAETAGLLRRARHAGAQAGLETGEPATAAVLAAAAVATDPADELAYRLLMRAHVGRGEPARALAAYERLRGELERELGVDPAPQTRDLHAAILRETDAPTPNRPVRTSPSTGGPTGAPAGGPASGRAGRAAGRAAVNACVGRDAEERQLADAFAAAAGGRGGLVLLTGEAGIGKTRLAEETIALAHQLGATVLRVRCYDAERSLFLQPFAELLSGLAARQSAADLGILSGGRLADLAGLVPDFAGASTVDPGSDRGVPGHADLQRRRVFEAVATLLRGLAGRSPVLVFLDDLHSAGLSTVELLHYLARTLAGARLLVLATVRVEEGEAALRTLADVATRLDLGPLPAEAVLALATEAGHAAMAAEILNQTRGHALYVVETLRGLRAGEAGLPATLQAAVLARVGRAGPGTEELLRTAAVVGATLDPTILARILGEPLPVVARRCEGALAARLLVVAGREYEFANDLIREVLYASTPEPTRVAHHLRAAELLDDRPEAVAEHAAAAGDWPRAARAFLVAGEEAQRRFAADDAHALLDRALDAADRAGLRGGDGATRGRSPAEGWELVGRILIARGCVRETLKRYEPALADLRAAIAAAQEAGDRRLEMTVLVKISGDVPIALGCPIADGVGHLRRGLRIAEGLADRGAEAGMLGRLAALAANQLQLGDALEYGRRAVAAGRAAGDERALAAGLDGLKTACFYLGAATELTTVIDELEPLLRRAGDLFHLQWTVFESAFAPLGAGDWDAARERMELAVELNRRSGFSAYAGWFTAHLGLLDRLGGDLDGAVRRGRAAVALAGVTPHPWWLPIPYTLLAATLLATGDTAGAIPLLREAREVAGVASGAPAHLAPPTALLAEATGSPELLAEADALLAAITAPAGSAWLYGAEAYLAVARGWLAQDEPARAHAALRPLLAATERVPWVPTQAEARRIDTRAGELNPAPVRATAARR